MSWQVTLFGGATTHMSVQLTDDRDDDGPLPNPKRGCGTLKRGKTYLVGAGFSPDGALPSWVECDPHVPFREIGTEGEFTRSYQRIDGLTLQYALENDVDFVPRYPDEVYGEAQEDCHESACENHQKGGVAIDVADLLEMSEADRHVTRVSERGAEGGSHWGEIPVADQTDLLMRCGVTYYPDPSDYVNEAIAHGLSKAIPVSPNGDPPTVVPGITRCWIMHPEACPGYGGGVIGYAYLSEVAFTEPDDGDVPAYISEAADAGKLNVRDIESPSDPDTGRPTDESDLSAFESDGGGAVSGYNNPDSSVWHSAQRCSGAVFSAAEAMDSTVAENRNLKPCGRCAGGEWPHKEGGDE